VTCPRPSSRSSAATSWAEAGARRRNASGWRRNAAASPRAIGVALPTQPHAQTADGLPTTGGPGARLRSWASGPGGRGPLPCRLIADPTKHGQRVQCRCNAQGLRRKKKWVSPTLPFVTFPAHAGALGSRMSTSRVGALVTGRFPPRSSRTPGAPSSGRSARLGPGKPQTRESCRTPPPDTATRPAFRKGPERTAASGGGTVWVRRLASARAPGVGPAAEAVEKREAHRRCRNQRERHEDPVRPADEHADRKAERE